MAPLSYVDNDLRFQYISIVLVPLMVKSYDSETGKLVLSLHGHSSLQTKLTAIQNTILQTVNANQHTWFPSEKNKTQEELAAGFQPLISNGSMNVYCPIITSGSYNEIQVYSGGTWVRGTFPKELLAVGQTVRIAVRLQGISFHLHHVSKAWTGRFRIQHRVLAIYT